MEPSKAKQILESVGYTVKTGSLASHITKTVNSLLESLESRNATRTKAYSILSEMARFNGRYTGSFAGLEDAGTVTLSVRGQEKEFDVAEALSKIENDFKSANSKGMAQKTAEVLLANFETALAATPEGANQEYVEELNKEKNYIRQCVESGEGIPRGGWTEESLARTTHSRDDSALDVKSLVGKIGNQITSLKRGGKNYDLIKARIDALMSRSDELTADEQAKVENLYVKLDLANAQGQARAVSSGKIAIFRPNEGVNPIRIRARLNNNNIPFTANENGTYTITKKVDQAKEVLEDYGSFVTPEAPAAPEAEGVAFKFETADDAAAVAEDVLPATGVQIKLNGEYIAIKGTKAQLKRANTEITNLGVPVEEIAITDFPVEEAAHVEESTKAEENEEQINEGLSGNKFGRTKHDLNEALVAELKDVPAADRKKIIHVLNDNGFDDRVKEYGFKADDDLGEFWFGVAQVLGFVPSHCEDLGNDIVKINGKKCKSALDAYKTIVFTSEVEGANDVDEPCENYLDAAARLTDYGSI